MFQAEDFGHLKYLLSSYIFLHLLFAPPTILSFVGRHNEFVYVLVDPDADCLLFPD